MLQVLWQHACNNLQGSGGISAVSCLREIYRLRVWSSHRTRACQEHVGAPVQLCICEHVDLSASRKRIRLRVVGEGG
jgi:hypothetical protein